MNHSAIVQPGFAMCVCGEPAEHPVHGFVEWVPKCRSDRRCMATEHDRNCPQAIAVELAAERNSTSSTIEDVLAGPMTITGRFAAIRAVDAARYAQSQAEHDLATTVSVYLEQLDNSDPDVVPYALAILRRDNARVDAARAAVTAAIDAL